jgi:hypothetical protein
MTGLQYLPPGRAIVAVAPRQGALLAVAEGVRVRRRDMRNRALLAAALTLVAVAPLLLNARGTTAGLEPAGPRPAPAPSVAAEALGGGHDTGPGMTGPGAPGDGTGRSTVPASPADPATSPTATPGPGLAGALTLTASEPSYGTVRVDRTTTVDLARAAPSFWGDYAGFAIGDAEVFYQHSNMPVVDTPSYRGAKSVTLRPGTYRVYVFTPAGKAATFTLPWSAPSLTVRPSVLVDTRYHPTTAYAGSGGGSGDGFGATAASSVTLVMAAFSPATAGVRLEGCLHHPPDACTPRVTAYAMGPSVHLSDRLAGDWSGYQYDVRVSGNASSVSPGVLKLLIFQYDRD